MKNFPNISFIKPDSLDGLNHLGKFLDEIQFLSGAIPSNQDGSHDPWDHLEAVMGLTTLGYKTQALKGLHWMSANQNDDGSWYNLYQDEEPLELNKQTNYASYIAVNILVSSSSLSVVACPFLPIPSVRINLDGSSSTHKLASKKCNCFAFKFDNV